MVGGCWFPIIVQALSALTIPSPRPFKHEFWTHFHIKSRVIGINLLACIRSKKKLYLLHKWQDSHFCRVREKGLIYSLILNFGEAYSQTWIVTHCSDKKHWSSHQGRPLVDRKCHSLNGTSSPWKSMLGWRVRLCFKTY